jgi:hypothetical protein
MLRRTLLTGAMLAPLVGTAPAEALVPSTMSGALAFEGTMSFSACTGGCTPTFGLSGSAQLAGVSTAGVPYVASWPLAVFAMSGAGDTESCLVPSLPPDEGSLSATFTLSGGTVVTGSTVLGGATLTGTLGWLHEGPVLVVQTWGETITGGGSTIATNLSPLVTSAGVGAMVWEGVPGGCTSPNTVASIVGGVSLASA